MPEITFGLLVNIRWNSPYNLIHFDKLNNEHFILDIKNDKFNFQVVYRIRLFNNYLLCF